MSISQNVRSIGSLALILSTVPVHAQSGGPINLNWHTHDGGGGSCLDGVTPVGGTKYSMSGTVGQPDTGAASAGTYSLQGGFVPAFIKTVGPALTLAREGNDLSFSWPASCTGFVLEGAVSADDQVWDSFGSGTITGEQHQLRLPGPLVHQFFRLRKDCPR